VVMPVRTTFYGAREIGVKDPAGHVVTFAQYGPARSTKMRRARRAPSAEKHFVLL